MELLFYTPYLSLTSYYVFLKKIARIKVKSETLPLPHKKWGKSKHHSSSNTACEQVSLPSENEQICALQHSKDEKK